MASVFFRRSQLTVEYDKSYQKIADLLSYIGGFLNIVLVIVGTMGNILIVALIFTIY